MNTAHQQYAWLLRQLAIALVVALLVARTLIPGEDAATGSGLLFVLLWLVAGVLWALACAIGRAGVYRANLIDLAVGLLVLAQVASAVFVAAARRPAINLAWEWAGLGLVYLLVRQLIEPGAPARALVMVVVALAFSLSLHGLYQYFWDFPELYKEYQQDRRGILSQVGIEPGDWEEEHFRQRLESQEPIATFALTNSLAGFLVVWLVVGLGAVPRQRRGTTSESKLPTETQRKPWLRIPRLTSSGWAALFGLAVIAACLVFTHSRTAYVGAAVGVMLLAIVRRRDAVQDDLEARSRIHWALGTCVVGVMALLVMVGRYFEHPVVQNAVASLEYRFEYWSGAWEMIQHHPLAGVGPGNFRQHYLRYKAASAGEEVIDPHNLLLEVWATGGILALVGLVAALGLFAFQMLTGSPVPTASHASAIPVLVGALGAWLIGFVMGVSDERLAGLAAGWALGLLLVGPLIRRTPLSAVWLFAGAAALVVNLAGQDGISIPPVAQCLLLVLALGASSVRAAGDGTLRLGQASVWTTTFAFFGATALCWTTAYRPVTESHTALAAAGAQLQRGNLRSAVGYAEQAAAADPFSTEPWIWLYGVYQRRWNKTADAGESSFEAAVDAAVEITERDPYWVEGYKMLGDLYIEQARRSGSKDDAEGAVAAYRRCVELYPASARHLADLAESLWLSGHRDEARRRALEALLMEQRTSHASQQLHPDVRRRMKQLQGTTRLPPTAKAPGAARSSAATIPTVESATWETPNRGFGPAASSIDPLLGRIKMETIERFVLHLIRFSRSGGVMWRYGP